MPERSRTVWRVRAVLGAALVIAGLGVSLPRSGAPPVRPSGGAIRVVSYNIRAGLGGLDEIAAEIGALSADVVALQEIERGVARSMQVDQPEQLARRLGMRHAFAASIASPGEGEHGIAVLSRFPIHDAEALPLPQGGGRWPRIALRATIEAPGGAFRMVCVHLARPMGWPLSLTATRLRQIETVLDALEEEPLPVVVAGDFNALPISPEAWRMQRRFGRAWRPWRDGWTPSFELTSIGWPLGAIPIDHVFHDRRWESRGFWSAPAGASDHRAVVADLLPGGGRD